MGTVTAGGRTRDRIDRPRSRLRGATVRRSRADYAPPILDSRTQT
ncbi:hypothetical protein GLE_5354 [Lysobacter enzymogenes]|uniref:Uncharacterized protein n=1 Tax=Lysobacter enzymogenes TaxID=69 RepID=A0A0S2DQ38_LYSEN|nr:hypothetical protein GLE_5354 [Lysobacter enzymogenes]